MTRKTPTRAPELAGARKFPFRNPAPGTKWAALLASLEYQPALCPKEKAQAELELWAERIAPEVIREKCIQAGHNPEDPYIKQLLDSELYVLIEVKAGQLEAALNAKSVGRGAPSNDWFLDCVAYLLFRLEEQRAAAKREARGIRHLARALNLPEDVLRKAIERGKRHYAVQAVKLSSSGDQEKLELLAASMNAITRALEEKWPEQAVGAKSPN